MSKKLQHQLVKTCGLNASGVKGAFQRLPQFRRCGPGDAAVGGDAPGDRDQFPVQTALSAQMFRSHGTGGGVEGDDQSQLLLAHTAPPLYRYFFKRIAGKMEIVKKEVNLS